MNSHRRKKSPASSPAEASRKPSRGVRFEWPLLAFPGALLVTLAILYVVDRSIRREMAVNPASEQVTPHKPPARTAMEPPAPTKALAGERVKPALRATPDLDEQGGLPAEGVRPAVSQERPDSGGRAATTREGTDQGAGLLAPEGPERIIAILQEAVHDKDQTRIKQCLDDLVALGDQGIAPLTQLIASGESESGVWAAEALARIGTPLATSTLLDTLSQVKEGRYKEELGKRVAGISNHESWPVLLDNVLETADSTVLRAAGSSLARMADTPVVDELIARYDGATTERDTERIAQLISNIHSSKATESLISLAGDVTSVPQDALERAAVEALGKIGDPQAISYLVRKLEASSPGQDGYLFNAIAQIKEPQAHDSLLHAAAGNKEVSAENGRTAAIYALKNFPDARTYALLEQIVAQEENARVVAAATRTLEDIRRTSPHVVANAQSLVKKDPYAPAEPIKK